MKTKYKIKIPVVGYVEKEVISNSLDEAIREVNQLITTSYDIEQGTEFKVLDYSVPHKLYEVIEELPLKRYNVTVPLSGYYSVDIEAFNIEEAIDLVLNDEKNYKNINTIENEYRIDFYIENLELDDNRDKILCDILL